MPRRTLLNREEQVLAYTAVALGGGVRQAAAACRRSQADVVRTLRRDRRFARRRRRARGTASRLPREERLMEGTPTVPHRLPSPRVLLREAERIRQDLLLADRSSPLLGWELSPTDPSPP